MPSEMEVNEMISRGKDEVIMFEEMDNEINMTSSRPKLMTADEVPSWVVEAEKPEKVGSTARTRKKQLFCMCGARLVRRKPGSKPMLIFVQEDSATDEDTAQGHRKRRRRKAAMISYKFTSSSSSEESEEEVGANT